MTSKFRPLSVMGRLMTILFGVMFGGVFLVAGLWIRSATQPLDDGVIVVGVVVDVDRRTDSDGDSTYSPIVDYVDPATGITHRIQGSVSSSSRPNIGSSKDVSLLPGDPSSARVVGPVWFPWIFIVIGVATPVVFLFGPLLGRKSRSGAKAAAGEGDHTWTIESDGVKPSTKKSAGSRPPLGVTQPGYHPDPDDDGRIRYWDGAAWTDMYAPSLFDD